MSDSSDSTAETWTEDINLVLKNLLANVDVLQKRHKQNYLLYENRLAFFRIPLICLSALNSVFSVGLNAYLEQTTVSTMNCLISLGCAVISAVELFLGIHGKMESELASYHGYKLLGNKISSTLKLEPQHREIEGIKFLTSIMSEYNKLFESSLVLQENLDDELFKNLKENFVEIPKILSPLISNECDRELCSPRASPRATPKQVSFQRDLQNRAQGESESGLHRRDDEFQLEEGTAQECLPQSK